MVVGLLLAVSFFGILALIFSPVFGQGRNGLEYSDALFNKLAKGSSYFIPKLTAEVKEFEKEDVSVDVKMENASQAALAAKVLGKGAPDTTSQGVQLSIRGNLAKLLASVLEDSNSMYFDKGDEVRQKYGMDPMEVMTTMWGALNRSVKELQKSKKNAQANIILEVIKKGIEPAYNFYTIEPQRVADKAFTVLGLLVFYIVYTIWWGFAIFYLFEGLGLSMEKAKVKKEI
jgi:hypothetical protein